MRRLNAALVMVLCISLFLVVRAFAHSHVDRIPEPFPVTATIIRPSPFPVPTIITSVSPGPTVTVRSTTTARPKPGPTVTKTATPKPSPSPTCLLHQVRKCR